MRSWLVTSASLAVRLAAAGALLLPVQVFAGQAAAPPQPAATAIRAEPAGEAATLEFFNRPIVTLRARVLGRSPAERAAGAKHLLDDLAARYISGPVERQSFESGFVISVAARGVLMLTPADVDELSGETLDQVSALAAGHMQQALTEAVEARAPDALLYSSVAAVVAVLVAALLLWAIGRARRIVGDWVLAFAERSMTRTGIADLDALRESRLLDLQRWPLTAAAGALDLLVIYAAVGFVLRRFPFTRPWGESMRGFLVTTFENLALGFAGAVPGLVTVLIVIMLARLANRLLGLWLKAIEQGRLAPRWIHPETAEPTRRLLTGLVWVFTAVVAYPYLPGSGTDAFKGISVLLGLMATVGASGLVSQIMSGFMITFSRALRVGDFVRIGDVEGTVTHLGVLSTKVRTLRREEVTVPNAVIVSQTTTDYSRFGDTEGIYTPTSVTIGYDAPWRQVQALLLLAAERTPGLRRQPKPIVLQAGLEDFYVKYALMVCLERQESRPYTLHALHTHIQDLFNEHGVQIMSPNYVVDPAAPKIVAKKDWYAPPAGEEAPVAPS